jgi:hypothetical protein
VDEGYARLQVDVTHFGEVILLSDWYVEPTQPYPAVLPRPQGGAVLVLVPAVLVSQWYVQPSEPVRTWPPRVPGLGLSVLQDNPAAFGEVILLSDWWQPASEPVKTRWLHPATPGFYALQDDVTHFGEVVYVSEWYVQCSEPVRGRPPSPEGAITFLENPADLEKIFADKWWRQPSEPVRSREPLRLPGWFSLVLDQSQIAGFIPADQWWVQPSEPVKVGLPRCAVLGVFALEFTPPPIAVGLLFVASRFLKFQAGTYQADDGP